MATVNFVKKARKDNPAVKKGESYYWWAFRFGGTHYSKTQPRPSQLTQSEFLSTIYSIGEDLEDAEASENLRENIADAISNLETLQEETRDKFDNMPEGLQQGDTGQLLEERVSAIDDMLSELNAIDTEPGDDLDEAALKEFWENVKDEATQVSYNGG